MAEKAEERKIPLWLVAISILLPTSFSTLATSATNVAIPHISGFFAATVDEANWVITSYMIANACLILMTGWLEHLMGRKRLLKVFIGIFTRGSLKCAIAPSLNLMVLGRLIQGIGGGPMTPMSQAILLAAFPVEKRGLAMSLYGLAVMVFSILGPSFGGYIVDNLNWQYIYLVNIPVGIVSIFLVSRNIAEVKADSHMGKIDYPGMVALVLWVLSMQVVLDKGQQYNWFDCAWIFWLSLFSLSAFLFFVVWELENKNPLIDLRIFKDKNFFIGTILASSVNMIVFTTIFILPQFLQNLMGYTALLSGYSLAPRVFSCMVMILIVAPLMDLYDNRKLISIGFVFLAIATFMFVNINLSVSFWYISIPNVLLGIGVILTFIPTSSLVLGTLPREQIASGSSLHNLVKCLATAIVVSISSTLVARLSQVHQTYLVKNLSNYSLVFQNRFNSMVHTFMSSASSTFANTKANAYVYNQMLTQSRLMAYVDVFAIFALIAFILIPFPFLLNTNIKKDD